MKHTLPPRLRRPCALLLAALALLGAPIRAAEPMTNAHVIELVSGGLSEDLVVTAVENAEPGFDASPKGLLELSKSKVPAKIIEAVIKRAAPSAAPAKPGAADSAAPPADALMKPSDVILRHGEQQEVMKYLTPQTRTAARGFGGFGGLGIYSVLNGPAATLRIRERSPTFDVVVPEQAQPVSYLTLASFAVRPNRTREVLVGGGYQSFSSGIHPDRIIAVKSEKLPDQSKVPKGFTLYRVTPRAPLAAGEYAVVLATAGPQGVMTAWFSGTGNSYFDFGVE